MFQKAMPMSADVLTPTNCFDRAGRPHSNELFSPTTPRTVQHCPHSTHCAALRRTVSCPPRTVHCNELCTATNCFVPSTHCALQRTVSYPPRTVLSCENELFRSCPPRPVHSCENELFRALHAPQIHAFFLHRVKPLELQILLEHVDQLIHGGGESAFQLRFDELLRVVCRGEAEAKAAAGFWSKTRRICLRSSKNYLCNTCLVV